MLLCMIKGRGCFWLFNAPDKNEAIKVGLGILSHESLFIDRSKPPYSQSGIELSFFDPGIGYCQAISKTEEEITETSKENGILVIVKKS